MVADALNVAGGFHPRAMAQQAIQILEHMRTSPARIAGLTSRTIPITIQDSFGVIGRLLGTGVGKVTAFMVLLTCITIFMDGVRTDRAAATT
jgi:hypothetical protein